MIAQRPIIGSCVLALLALGCSSSEPPPAPSAPAPAAPEPSKPAEPAPPPPPQLVDPADPDEACGQIIVVAYKGAKYADEAITRDKAAAKARAAELLGKITAGTGFAELAKSASDAPSSAPRGGVMGTHRKEDWPELHGAMRDTLFGLKVNQVASEPVEADYGYVLVRRCKVEKAHAQHILIRYRGAKRAKPTITRDKAAARKLAEELRAKLVAGADFAELAKEASEDSSAVRGGDLGLQGRGRLAQAFEQALFSLPPGGLSPVVETEFGFHIITRPASD